MSCKTLVWFIAICVHQTLGNHTLEDVHGRETLVEMGAVITLVGISNEENIINRSAISWYKDGYMILKENSFKYKFLHSETELVINGFMTPDVGQYTFVYSTNSTNQRRVFRLGLLPTSLLPWYRRNPKVTGTIIGMIFLALLILAMGYYCCNADTDVIVGPMSNQQLRALPYPIQDNNKCNYSGMKFSPGIHVATNTGRQKSCREVRHESITALGTVSKQSINKLKKTRAARTNTVSFSSVLTRV